MAQAQELIARLLSRVTDIDIDSVPLRSALGRVLAADIVSPINVPTHDNSAMDGYALRSGELMADADSRFSVAGTSLAGQAFKGTAADGLRARIMTWA